MASDAAKAGDDKKAAHLFTMAIDVAAKGMQIDKDGKASDADLEACNKRNEGKLAKLLSDRSRVYLRLGDIAGAIEDADTCTRAEPTFEKGHVRLAVAYEAAGAALQVQLESCERGLAACPGSELLVARKWRLKKAIAEQPGAAQAEGASAAGMESALETARRLADDPKDPRRAMAAADWGSILATGAHGVNKDLASAERYLRLGSQGGDVSAQRNLGLVLLEMQRPAEAAEELGKAAAAGDEQAAEVLEQLAGEAQAMRAEARAKLEELAADGDPRATAMLKELLAQE